MWSLYALYFAIIKGINFYFFKRLTRDFSPLVQLVNTFIFTIPFSFLLLILFFQIPHVSSSFWIFTFLSGTFDLIAFFLTFKAFKDEDLSLLAPLSSFIPVFSLILAALFLREYPGAIKILGIFLVVSGTYFLNLSDTKHGLFKPFTNLLKSKGLLMFLAANAIWSITPIFQKKAIEATTPSTPLFASFIGFCFITFFGLLIAVLKKERIFSKTMKNARLLTLQGVMGATAQLAAFTAFALAPLAYSLSLFNFSTLVTIGIGALFLKEQKTRDRLLGAIVMIVGSLLIIF